MENQDKIYSQFRNAADKEEPSTVPNSDKIWNRVEEKLDRKVLKKQNKLWKKIAVAASILLVASIAFQLAKPDEVIEIPQNNIVILDTVQDNTSITNAEAAVTSADSASALKPEADKILQNVISSQSQVAVVEKNLAPSAPASEADKVNAGNLDEEIGRSDGFLGKRKFSAVGVQYADESAEVAKENKNSQETVQKKEEPILIIDNTAVTSKKGENYSVTSKEEMAKLNADDIQTVVYLKEPLYVIDGKHYSEEEMFGPNPTSPYAPLSAQEIKKTVVLQGKEAISAYGKKGEKGVLIITTKYGRPAKKSVKKP